MSHAVEHPTAALPTVGLLELSRWAHYQTRRDRKYLVPRDAVEELVAALPPARVLSIDGATSFRYESVYFDTDDLTSYAAAAKRRPRRFKVRTRSYVESEESMLEVKVRDPRGQTVKHRTAHPFDRRGELTAEGERFLRTLPAVTSPARDLQAVVVTSYRRSTFMLDDRQARVTVDTDLRWATADGDRARAAGCGHHRDEDPRPAEQLRPGVVAGGLPAFDGEQVLHGSRRPATGSAGEQVASGPEPRARAHPGNVR